MSLRVGEIVGDYEVLGILGQGGMGAVYRVRNVISQREEAMKIALARAETDPQAHERFVREIRVQATLRHPNIAELRTAVRAGGQVLMILELMQGDTLASRIRKGPLRFDEAHPIMDHVLNALAYAHEQGVVHRDIKPANIMLTASGVTKLMDFGIARAASEDRITMTSALVGSLHYMSPEQIRSNAADERSDLYSLGVTLYETLTGRLPVEGNSAYEIMHAHMSVRPHPPDALVLGLPTPISEVVMKSLEKSPALRYSSAQAFQSALRDSMSGDQVTKTVLSPSSPALPATAPVQGLDVALLNRIEKRLSSAIGPIAKNLVAKAAERHASIDSLCEELSVNIPDAKERADFLRSFGLASGAKPASDSSSGRTSLSSTGLTGEAIEHARRALAQYIGPMAKIIVNRKLKEAAGIEELWNVLAAEIPDERDQKAFRARLKS